MFVSLHLSPQSRGEDEDLAIVERTLGQAVRAERHGAAAVCLTEHHLGGFNTYVDPFMFGARLGAELTTASIAVTVARVPMHHPLRLAEQCNLLDLLTHGRAFVALAQGWSLPVEEEAFGMKGDGKQITDERIDVVLELLSSGGEERPREISTTP
jgi:alkanesulfonate monooxygenase SsuD/methylene tetrahydromethanopterin reductase-like flavin-dependent oxidoreductase (luciferase family)